MPHREKFKILTLCPDVGLFTKPSSAATFQGLLRRDHITELDGEVAPAGNTKRSKRNAKDTEAALDAKDLDKKEIKAAFEILGPAAAIAAVSSGKSLTSTTRGNQTLPAEGPKHLNK